MINDAELIRRYATLREADAFAELVRRHAGTVFAVARRATGSAADAEDVCQLCFLELARKADAITGSIAAWLHTTATHRSMDLARNRGTRCHHETAAARPADAVNSTVAGEREAFDAIISEVDAALADLPPDLRVPIIEHYLRSRSQSELAKELNVNQSTVSRRLRDGIEQLREILATRGVTAPAVALPVALAHGTSQAAPPALAASLNKLALAGADNAASAGPATTAAWFVAKPVVLTVAVIAIFTVVAWPFIRSTLNPRPLNQGAPMAQAANPPALFDIAIPGIPVRDIGKAVEFYRDKLGFEVAYRNGNVYALMKRGNAEVGLSPEKEGFQAGAGGAYFRVADVNATYREYVDAGVTIPQAPAMQEFGLRDFVFEDLDGNRFGVGGPAEVAPADAGAVYENTMPMIPVPDLRAAVDYYTNVLGFEDGWFWGTPATDGGVRRNGKDAFMFEHAPDRAAAMRGATYIVFVRPVDAIYARHQAAGAKIISDIENKAWGTREYTVEDLNGYRLRFSQYATNPDPDNPSEGEIAASRFRGKTIILPVSDIYRTLAWYEKALRFQTRYIHGNGRRGEARDYANYLIMFRDDVEVHFILDESNNGAGGSAVGWQQPGNGYLGLIVTDADAIYQQVRDAGIDIDGEVRQMNWPARGFNLKDPDGNAVHIEQPTL